MNEIDRFIFFLPGTAEEVWSQTTEFESMVTELFNSIVQTGWRCAEKRMKLIKLIDYVFNN